MGERMMVMNVQGKRSRERQIEAEMDGQHRSQFDREGIIGRRCTRPGCMEANSPETLTPHK